MTRKLIKVCVSFVCAAATFGSASPAEDWPQFRGPNCSGVSQSAASLPHRFSPEENCVWSAKLGDGIGSPVVAAGRLFVSEMAGDSTVALVAFDAATGKKLWRREFETGSLAEIHKINSHASTTPAADDERVYFYFTTLGLKAFDAATGEDCWTVDLPVPYFVFKWGAGMSPVIHGETVLFCQDDDLSPALYAVDRKSGKVRWKADRSEMAVNYSHPVICETPTGTEVIVAGTGKLIGYDLETGRQKWFARTLLRNIKTTPAVADGIVYISLQSAGIASQWLATADKNSDGKVTKDEIQTFVGETPIPEPFWAKFDRGDRNRDGFLEGEELDLAFLHPDNFAGARFDAADPAQQLVLAVRAGGEGDVTESHVLWKHENRAPDHLCSPIVVDGRMLTVKGGGISSCFETSRGEPIWYLKRIQNIGEYFASPVAGDGKIFVAGENGTVVVLKNAPELTVLALNDLGDSCLATPAIADGRLFVRTRTRLYAFAEQQ